MAIDKTLPSQEFVDRQIIAFAGIIEAQKSATHCSDDFRLSADDPAFGIRRREVCDGQWAAVGSTDITQEGTLYFGHGAHTHNLDLGALYARMFNGCLNAITLIFANEGIRRVRWFFGVRALP